LINPLNPPVAPTLPSDAALLGAMALLQSLGNARSTAATLSQLADHKLAIDKATAELAAVSAQAAEVQAAQDALAAREKAVSEREATVANAQTALDVASAANVARAEALETRQRDLASVMATFEAKVKAHNDQIASVRAALA
jgi:chromosome segregation ATPase